MFDPARRALGGIPDVFHRVAKAPAKRPSRKTTPPTQLVNAGPKAPQSAAADASADNEDCSICRWDEV